MFVVIFSIKYCLNVFLNTLWSDKILIDNGKLFHRFPPEYIKLHLNKSNLGRVLQVCVNVCSGLNESLILDLMVHNQILFYA